MDSYAATKYIIEKQSGFFDKGRLALHGDSAGGHMIIGVSMELAKRDEGNLVKVVVPHIAAMSAVWLDYTPESKELNWV
jgi:acetyl esterase/lipase